MVRIVWVVLHKGLRSWNRWLSAEAEEQFRLLICHLIIICDSPKFMSYHISKRLFITIDLQTDQGRFSHHIFVNRMRATKKLLTCNENGANVSAVYVTAIS